MRLECLQAPMATSIPTSLLTVVPPKQERRNFALKLPVVLNLIGLIKYFPRRMSATGAYD